LAVTSSKTSSKNIKTWLCTVRILSPTPYCSPFFALIFALKGKQKAKEALVQLIQKFGDGTGDLWR
jgi:hypothetical protein